MRRIYNQEISFPSEVSCEFDPAGKILKFKKDNENIERKINLPGTDIKIEENKIKFICQKANKKDIAIVKSNLAHVKNMLADFNSGFTYELEIAHVHFPITAKVEKDKLIIKNFLGEKVNREAQILHGVSVEVKGQKITVRGRDIEKAGQTAANIEKASRISKRDRRIFQDGIYITSKPEAVK